MNEQEDKSEFDNQDSSTYVSPLSQSGRPPTSEKCYGNTPASGLVKFTTKRTFSGFCDVCDIRLNSHDQSKSHYEGKPHAKRLKKKAAEEAAAINNDEVTQSICKKRSNSSMQEDGSPKKKSHSVPVTQLYCSACDLTFTSEAHAKDHYLGRNHDRVIHGLAPYFQGYFNTSTNKWQRTPPDPRVSTQLLSSEPPENMKGKTPHQDKPKIRGKYHCQLCNISLTCEVQLNSHLEGSKHAKNVKRKENSEDTSGAFNKEAHLKSIKCDLCNVLVNSTVQYESHISSKKHKRNVSIQSSEKSADDASCSTEADSSADKPQAPGEPLLNCDYDPFDPAAEGNI